MKIETILVPLDGSPLAETALPPALELARDHPTARLILLRAAEASTLPGVDPTEVQVRVVREAEEYLDRIAARLADQGAKNVATSVWYGQAASAIVEAAEVNKASLIVMSSHGRSGLGRLIFGSVAESVLRGTRTPILLLRPAGAPLATPPGSAVSRSPKEGSHV